MRSLSPKYRPPVAQEQRPRCPSARQASDLSRHGKETAWRRHVSAHCPRRRLQRYTPAPLLLTAAASRRRSRRAGVLARREPPTHRFSRSEEHTSELQSLMRISYAVFCLKTKTTQTLTTYTILHN